MLKCVPNSPLLLKKDAINEKNVLIHFLTETKKAKNEETQTLNSQAYANPNVINCI